MLLQGHSCETSEMDSTDDERIKASYEEAKKKGLIGDSLSETSIHRTAEHESSNQKPADKRSTNDEKWELTLSTISSYRDRVLERVISREEFDSSEMFTDSIPEGYGETSEGDANIDPNFLSPRTDIETVKCEDGAMESHLSSQAEGQWGEKREGAEREDVQSENENWKTPAPDGKAALGSSLLPVYL